MRQQDLFVKGSKMIRTINPYTKQLQAQRAQLVKALAPRLKLSPEAQAKIDQARAESHETRREKLFAMQLSQYQGA